MKIHFYPYDIRYKIKDEGIFVHLYSKLEDGQKVCVTVEHQPYFYAKVKDEPFLEERFKAIKIQIKDKEGFILNWEIVEKDLLGKKEQFYKIFTNVPKAVPPISKELESLGMKCYEKDILFTHRFLRDKNLLPLALTEAEGEFIQDASLRVPNFRAENIKLESKTTLTNLKCLAIDIETYAETRIIDFQRNPILMIAFSGIDENNQTFRKVLTWKRFKHNLDYLEIVSDEAELLHRFREIILDYQPDIITGYNSDSFDLAYLKARADKFKIKLDIGKDRSELQAGKSSKIAGILHLDLYRFIRGIFGRNLKTESFSLDAVSNELIGHQKHDVNIEELYLAWDDDPDKLEEFCKYNMHDADLTLKLCKKLLLDMIEVSQIVGVPIFSTIRMSFSRLVESYIMKQAMRFNVLAPNRPSSYQTEQRMEETYEGGFVYEPKPGLYENLVVFDFRSLYPTIIMAHNIGPESFQCECCKENKVPGMEEYWFCSLRKSFLSTILEELILRRADLKRLIKKADQNEKAILDARSYAIKLLANAFYGYMGYFGARWYCFQCARTTTAYARNYIKKTIQKAEEQKFKVCYADTDSCFMLLGNKTLDEAKGFMVTINADLPGQMELEYEGYYPRAIFVSLKGGDKGSEKAKLSGTSRDKKSLVGAKKKYALLDKEGKVKITGFETVRRNWSQIAKEVQEDVLNLVLQDKVDDALLYVKDIVQELKEGKISKKKLIIKTKITRPLDSYTSVGPHVAVARKMVERGYPISPGSVVEYIITTGSGLVRERAQLVNEVKEGKYDANYYLNNQIIPAVESILAVFGYSEEDILSKSKQKGLGEFIQS